MTDQEHQAPVKFDTKKVYFFAGPHKTASTSVEKFFAKWAEDGFHHGHHKTYGLQYWRWPTFDESEGENQYGALVQRKDNVAYEKRALDVISERFEESDNGVFLGTEEFDQVGPDKYYNALPVMETITMKLNVGPQDTKVIMNYRTPRLDQWVSIWKHADKHYADSSYGYFLCEAHLREKDHKQRRSMIGAEMNPLGAAKIFLEKGWSVTIMDMGGITKAGQHIVHAIGCDVLMGGCDEDGNLGGLKDYLPNKNAVDKEFVGLAFQDAQKVEQLFTDRDCAYQKLLEPYVKTGQLEILYQDSLWVACDAPQKYYEKFIDNTDLMYDALVGQVKCDDDPEDFVLGADMDAALEGGDLLAKESPLSLVNISFFDIGLTVALLIALFQIIRQRTRGQNGQQSRAATELTTYPRRVYKDESDDDDDVAESSGGFRDDVSLDEEEVSDTPKPTAKGGSLSGRI
ncbi:unnamed protein product [Cylindrotheca closterium]|uniref:Uncharacterized protein n=1 Tax=Cylindrotheca closterium TaxID=2856 RepID=A0AAD2JKD9_9STRA|nr:unnamed protein product [Cylindrotheca closterium]